MAALRLARLLDEACGRHPDKADIVSGDRQLSYAELRELAARLAGALTDAGLAGDRIATLLPNGPELIVCYLACWAAGVTMVRFEYVDAPPGTGTGRRRIVRWSSTDGCRPATWDCRTRRATTGSSGA